MADIILLNKPFNCLSQFTSDDSKTTLTDVFSDHPLDSTFYAAGRLDYDSEGLLLLTNDGQLQNRVSAPSLKMPKTYWVQVEGEPSSEAIRQLSEGVELKDGRTAPARIKQLEPAPDVWARHPPVRERSNIPTHWLSITISEGRNRQVRRMTAAVGLPTLRLIRVAIGHWQLHSLQPGEYRRESVNLPKTRPQHYSQHRRKKR